MASLAIENTKRNRLQRIPGAEDPTELECEIVQRKIGGSVRQLSKLDAFL